MRIALGIEYDGTDYHGWQRQESVPSVQEKVEQALSKVADETIIVHCAGRTDAGVHASEQVIHFDTEAKRPDRAWILGTNTNLPSDIRILWAKHVSPDFHARYSAISRQYRYMIYNNKISSALLRHRAMHWEYPLDIKLMQEAAEYLIGEHDFSSFRGSGCQSNTPVRRVDLINIYSNGAIINIDVKANAFVLHMVRNIIGVLIKIGNKEQLPIWAKEVLELKDRTKAAITANPEGLYLVKVEYSC